MKTHSEQDLLSAFVDGELTEREQVTLEAHLASCADCRGVLGALRATLGDLASIPEAVPSQRDSWALRSAIAKQRRLDRRGRRWYLISGGAAAALVAILGFALSSSSDGPGGGGIRALGANARHSVQLSHNSVNYTDSSARAVLLSFSSVTQESMNDSAWLSGGPGGGAGDTAPTASESTQLNAYQSRTAAGMAKSAETDEAVLNRCIDTVTGSTDQAFTPRHFEAASFDGKPVFLLVFEFTEAKRLELWVVRRDDCSPLFWAQTRA